MQDSFPVPSCFSSAEMFTEDPSFGSSVAKSGQSVVMSMYHAKIAGHCRLITVTWCRNLLIHGLSISIQGSDDFQHNSIQYSCKVELRPWYFWRKHGSKRFIVEEKPVDVLWDLRNASFSGDTEPRSGYYVALIADEEVVLLLGDLKKDAFRRSGCRPSITDVALVAKKEHVFGKKRFLTRSRFDEKGVHHDISIECICSNSSGSSIGGNMDPEMVITIDGSVAVRVKHLQWKFRGNETISVCKSKVEVYWDVHDWLFSPGMRHALFIFKPSSPPASSSSSLSSLFSSMDGNSSSSLGFCLFLYAWKLE